MAMARMLVYSMEKTAAVCQTMQWNVKKTLRNGTKSCYLGNDQLREGVAYTRIIGGERGSEGPSLTFQAVKEIAGDLCFQTLLSLGQGSPIPRLWLSTGLWPVSGWSECAHARAAQLV